MPHRTEAVSLCMKSFESRLVFSAVGKYINGNAVKEKLLSIWGNVLIDLLAQRDECTTLLLYSVNMKTGNRGQQLACLCPTLNQNLHLLVIAECVKEGVLVIIRQLLFHRGICAEMFT